MKGSRKMSPRKSLKVLSLSLVLLALSAMSPLPALPAMPASAAKPTAVPLAQERFEDTSQVLAVEVPVNVTGRDGQPVRGLKATDFEVFDEGSAQPITGFDVVDLDLLGAGEAGAAPGTPSASAGAGPVASRQLEASARRHFLLLFDLSFSNPIAILKARLAAREFLLNSLKPSDLAAVVKNEGGDGTIRVEVHRNGEALFDA